MRRIVYLGCLLIILTAGCNSFLSPSPSPSQSETTTTLSGTLAPGVTADGVTSAEKLTAAHARILTEESFTYHQTLNLRYANGTLLRHKSTTIQATHNNTHFRSNTAYAGQIPALLGASQGKIKYWSNGTETLRRITVNGENNYRLLPDRPTMLGSLTTRDRLYLFVTASTIQSITKANNSSSAPNLYRLHSSNLSTPSSLVRSFQPVTVTNGSFTAVVDSWGVVHRYSFTGTGTYNGSTIRIQETANYSA
ncbi:hypothetical protein, partial [Haladaptatus sp. DYF46]|uniref:DUF7537 family lipoprotein n=1 Tax=Haladaptatus sp. DYF46 TaxID=2886041 RepID=UPI001E47B225